MNEKQIVGALHVYHTPTRKSHLIRHRRRAPAVAECVSNKSVVGGGSLLRRRSEDRRSNDWHPADALDEAQQLFETPVVEVTRCLI